MPDFDFPLSLANRSKRPVDRSRAYGVLLSIAIHALLIGAFYLSHLTGGSDRSGTADSSAIKVFLVSEARNDLEARSGPQAPETEASAVAPAPAAGVVPDRVATAGKVRLPLPGSTPSSHLDGSDATAGGSVAAPRSAMVDLAIGDDYRRRLLAHIQGYRQRVQAEAGQSSSGVVMVKFLINRNGDVLVASVASSSGIADFDDEAIATIWRARPMPVIPSVLPENLSVTLPIRFGAQFAGIPR